MKVVCDLIEKLTGVVIDTEEDLILHLIKCGISDVRKGADRIIVRISPDDVPTAEQHKNTASAVTNDIIAKKKYKQLQIYAKKYPRIDY